MKDWPSLLLTYVNEMSTLIFHHACALISINQVAGKKFMFFFLLIIAS